MKSWARVGAGWLIISLSIGGCSHDWDSLRAEGHIADHICDGTESCDFDCLGAGCTVQCSSLSQCSAHCPQGGCEFDCLDVATCDFSCAGGACVFVCDSGATCTTSCDGGACSMR